MRAKVRRVVEQIARKRVHLLDLQEAASDARPERSSRGPGGWPVLPTLGVAH